MKKLIGAVVVVPFLVAAGVLGGASAATAHDVECATQVWSMPFESMQLPEGWTWSFLRLDPDERDALSGSIEGPEPEPDPDGSPVSPNYLGFSIWCEPAAATWMEQDARLREVVGDDDVQRVTIVPLGDEVVAYRTTYYSEYLDETSTYYQVLFRSGSVIVRVSPDEDMDWADAEAFAMEIDALLP